MQPVSRVNPATDLNKNKHNPGVEPGSSNMNSAQSRTSSEAEDFSTLGGDDLSNIKEKAVEYKEKAQGLATDTLDKVRHYGSEAMDQSGSFIRRYPAPILLAGLGIGMLAGFFIGRR